MLDAQHSMKGLEEQLLRAQAQLAEAAAAKEGAEAAARKLRAASERSASTALAAAEARCADLEERLRAAQACAPAGQLTEPTHAARDSAGNGPPAMAGPGVPHALAPCRFAQASVASKTSYGMTPHSGRSRAGGLSVRACCAQAAAGCW